MGMSDSEYDGNCREALNREALIGTQISVIDRKTAALTDLGSNLVLRKSAMLGLVEHNIILSGQKDV